MISPVDETVVECSRPLYRAETDERVERAHRAFATWWRGRAGGPGQAALRRFAEAVDADIETLAALEVRNASTTAWSATPAGARATCATC